MILLITFPQPLCRLLLTQSYLPILLLNNPFLRLKEFANSVSNQIQRDDFRMDVPYETKNITVGADSISLTLLMGAFTINPLCKITAKT